MGYAKSSTLDEIYGDLSLLHFEHDLIDITGIVSTRIIWTANMMTYSLIRATPGLQVINGKEIDMVTFELSVAIGDENVTVDGVFIYRDQVFTVDYILIERSEP